jgi:hypothetical protein
MKISLSRFGFCGIVIQELQSWKDTIIIVWFTMIRMIIPSLLFTSERDKIALPRNREAQTGLRWFQVYKTVW